MDKNNMDICSGNPRDSACDIVRYATGLDEAEHRKNMAEMTVGSQPGFTKTSVDGVMDAFKGE